MLVTRDGEVVTISLNRPDKLNALNSEVFGLLQQALEEIEADASVRVAVLRGEGRAFAAGADIEDYVDIDQATYLRFVETGRRVLDGIARLRVPVIASVRGFALGGGFELALACDLMIVAENARLGLPETRLGLLPGGGGTQRLPRLVGRMRAASVILAGRVLTGADAVAWGLATEVVPKDDLPAATAALAQSIVQPGAARRRAGQAPPAGGGGHAARHRDQPREPRDQRPAGLGRCARGRRRVHGEARAPLRWPLTASSCAASRGTTRAASHRSS